MLMVNTIGERVGPLPYNYLIFAHQLGDNGLFILFLTQKLTHMNLETRQILSELFTDNSEFAQTVG